MLVATLVSLLSSLQSGPVRDSVEAVAAVRATIDAHYHLAINASNWPKSVLVWSPPPRREPASCRGVSFDDCFGGDWSCRIGIDCKHPDQAERFATLIRAIEEIAPLAGGSELVFRQRTGLADKNHEYERAYRIANTCFGTEWWCLALRGFAQHRIQPGAGLAEFDSALAIAPRAVRCAWLDISPLVPRAVTSGIPDLCSSTSAAYQKFWWLADPLWSRAGNERMADHMARHVMEAIEADLWDPRNNGGCRFVAEGYPNSRRLHIVQFKPALRENATSLRTQCLNQPTYGRELRTRDIVRTYAEFREVYGGYSFVPDSARFWTPMLSAAPDWELTWDQGIERLVTRERFYNLRHQTAVFRRGPELLVAAAAELPAPLDTVSRPKAFLALGRVADLQIFAEPAHIDSARVVHGTIRVDSGAYLTSIEVVGQHAIGRARHGAPAPPLVNGFGVSDIALVDARFATDTLDVAEALLPTLVLSRRERVGIYFEVYGVTNREIIDVSLASGAVSRSLLGSVRRFFGAGSTTPLRVSWRDDVEQVIGLTFRRFFLLDASTVPAGRNQLTLTVRRANGASASVARFVEVK